MIEQKTENLLTHNGWRKERECESKVKGCAGWRDRGREEGRGRESEREREGGMGRERGGC